ncbi:MAG: helicase C-terminal domain-containing protein [Planctomycetota bacterium]
MSRVVERVLGPGGLVEAALAERGLGYEARGPQLRMAEAIAQAMEGRRHLLVEAGTGVGKSFAYLVPAIERCLNQGETVVIATNTISLQEQLIEKDVPLLSATVASERDDDNRWSGRIRPVLVKGRGNYLSVRRLRMASEKQDRLFADAPSRRSLAVIEDWAYETTDGTLSTLPVIERPGVWDRVRSDSGNCMGRKCPTYELCFYQSARREMESANLLICNHALFFSDLALRTRGVGFLPRYDQVVLDEAHGVEDAAADHFGLSLGEGGVRHLLSMLYQPKTRKGFLAQLAVEGGEEAAIDRVIGQVLRAGEAADRFFESVERLVDSGASNGRVRRPNAVENLITTAMNDLAGGLRRLKEISPKEPDKFELNAYSIRAAEQADAAEAWCDQTLEGCAYWAESPRAEHSGRRRTTVACSPIEVGPLLAENLFDRDVGVVLTSATLATRQGTDDETKESAETAFAHTMDRLGCTGSETMQLGSPFEFSRQVELYVDRTMPSPKHAGHAQLTVELTSRVLDHVSETDGGAFVLFTSFKQLNDVADRLRGPLAELGYPLLAQGRDGPRGEILSRFREDPRSVLLGAASFWQGVDVRGQGLRNVIITRLPFEPPDRPLTEARLERIEARGGDPFREDSLPRAILRFKQGFGRLIRSADDRGRVVILDPRVTTTGYGRAFLRALPEGLEIRTIPDQS